MGKDKKMSDLGQKTKNLMENIKDEVNETGEMLKKQIKKMK